MLRLCPSRRKRKAKATTRIHPKRPKPKRLKRTEPSSSLKRSKRIKRLQPSGATETSETSETSETAKTAETAMAPSSALLRASLPSPPLLASRHGCPSPLRLFLVAGEPSGDAIGAKLMRALRAEHAGPISWGGVGGEGMSRQGLSSLFPLSELSLMGFSELVPSLPRLAYRLHQTTAAARAMRAHAVVGIDSKGFCLRVLGALASQRQAAANAPAHAPQPPHSPPHSPPSPHPSPLQPTPSPLLVQYVAPSAWAFGDALSRARRLRGVVDELFLLLPFEQPLFEQAGVPSTFVGHPSIEEEGVGWWRRERSEGVREASQLLHRFGVPPAATVITLLPGSRKSEVRNILPLLLDALAELRASPSRGGERRDGGEGTGGLVAFLPAASAVRGEVERVMASRYDRWGVHVIGEEERRAAYRASQLAIACCGTVNVELALSSTPQVAVWRASSLTHLLLRHWLKPTLAHASLPNLLWHEARMGAVCGPSSYPPLVEECLLEGCSAKSIAKAARALLEQPERAARRAEEAMRAVERVAARTSTGEVIPPSTRAARRLLQRVGASRS